MKYHLTFLLFLGLIGTTTLSGQDFELPSDASFSAPADYRSAHRQIVAAVDWLLATPLDVKPEKRKAVGAYLVEFLTGSPDVSIALGPLALFDDCPDCLIAFMAGWARHAITEEAYRDTQGGKLAGVRAVMQLYDNNRATLGKIKKVEKFRKLDAKGKLADWVAQQQ